MRRPPAELNPLNRGFASLAGLAGSLIRQEFKAILTRLAGGIAEIRGGSAAKLNRFI